MSLDQLNTLLNQSESYSIFSYDRIWKNRTPLCEKYKTFMSPDSNAYYSSLNPIFSFELEENNFQSFKIFSMLSLRDGVYPLLRFFTMNPTPHEIDPILIVDARLSSIVPEAWRKKVYLREVFVEEKPLKEKANELLLVLFPDKDAMPLDSFEKEFSKIKDHLDSFTNISIFFSTCTLTGQEDAEYDFLWGYKLLNILSERLAGKNVSIISFSELQKKNLSQTAFHFFNPFLFYFSDSYLLHDLFQRGGRSLLMCSGKENHRTSVNVSINHGFNLHQNFSSAEHVCDDFLMKKIFKSAIYEPPVDEDYATLRLSTKDFKDWALSIASKIYGN